MINGFGPSLDQSYWRAFTYAKPNSVPEKSNSSVTRVPSALAIRSYVGNGGLVRPRSMALR